MKPIATLKKPLDSVNVVRKQTVKASVVRSDTCAVVACGVVAENMAAIAVAESFLEKFGCDTLDEVRSNYQNYILSRAKCFGLSNR